MKGDGTLKKPSESVRGCRGGVALGASLPGGSKTDCLKLPVRAAGNLIKTGGGGKRAAEADHT